MTNVITDVLGFLDEKRKNITPEYTRNGKPVYTLRKYADMTDIDAEVLTNGGTMNMAELVPTFGRNGSLLRTPRTSYAVNIDIAFDNRVKIVDVVDEATGEVTGKEYLFVVDQRALQDQSLGRLYANYVNAYRIGKNGKKLVVKGIEHIYPDEFFNEFDATFDTTAMEEIMDLINHYKLEHGTAKVVEKLEF